MRHPLLLLCLLSHFVSSSVTAQDNENGFRPMFNGKDLSGWQRVNTAESTWSFQDGMLVCTGKPIGELRTERMYQNFIMELEWRHMVPKGNAGVFVWADDITAKGVPFHRGIEVQVLENAYGNTKGYSTHGDIFPIHGASMEPVNGRGGQRAFPIEERSNPSPEWNHYRITCIDGDISLAVNGKVVTEGKKCNPRKGYICIESEGGVVHYRNVKIQELPDTPIDEKMIAIGERGYRTLYNGIDLENWNAVKDFWKPNDWVLEYRSPINHTGVLSTRETFGDCKLLFDMRRQNAESFLTLVFADPSVRHSDTPIDITFHPESPPLYSHLSKVGQWDRIEIVLKGDQISVSVNGEIVLTKEAHRQGKEAISFQPGGDIDFANIYVSKLESVAIPPPTE